MPRKKEENLSGFVLSDMQQLPQRLHEPNPVYKEIIKQASEKEGKVIKVTLPNVKTKTLFYALKNVMTGTSYKDQFSVHIRGSDVYLKKKTE